MASPQALIIHERLGNWARQLRPRMANVELQVFESRSRSELCDRVGCLPCPLVLIDLGDRPVEMLGDLMEAVTIAPNALVLVLDPKSRPLAREAARELGATHVISGSAIPPDVSELLHRWAGLARKRTESDGWFSGLPPSTRARDRIDELIAAAHSSLRAASQAPSDPTL